MKTVNPLTHSRGQKHINVEALYISVVGASGVRYGGGWGALSPANNVRVIRNILFQKLLTFAFLLESTGIFLPSVNTEAACLESPL